MRVLIVGMGKSGVSAAKLAVKKGGRVTVSDLKNKTDLLPALEELKNYKFRAELGKHVLKTFVEQDLIVVSPGVDLNCKPLKQAEKTNVPIVSEVEFASQFITKPIIAVTGTNGKTTVATLISEMINQGGKSAFLCGNIGVPLSEFVVRRDRSEYVVLEISSFQLDATYTLKPAIAIYVNIAPDHLDKYETFEKYIESKMRLHPNMTEEDHIITNLRDHKLMSLLSGCKPKMMTFTSDSMGKIPVQFIESFQGTYLEKNMTIQLKSNRWKGHTFMANKVKLRGIHNKENMMAALLAAKLVGITNESIQKVINTFEALPHRMEFVGRRNQVNFINNSKGTNVHSLYHSLESFETPVILIAGGRDKGEDYGILADTIEDHVKNLILVGEAKEKINRAVGDYSETFLVGTFEEAVYLAYQKARSGDVILLSPGCASQDMFNNYEHRGDFFKSIVARF